MNTVILASGNTGKLREFKNILLDVGFDVKPQAEYQVPDAEETGLTFVENAILKARNACEHTGLPAISDDSGIEVDAIDGAPGIYSARFAGEGSHREEKDHANNLKLLHDLNNTPDEKRTARYQCVLVFMRHAKDPTPIIAQGAWEGSILRTPKGENGFGYDPLFWVPTHNCSSAQLDKAEKNRISHRAIAMQALLKQLQKIRA
ncbi:MAG: RdgB/HAM1 family non-canonical purine NTP pyrophosphatase [Agarilytica sp.]